MLKELMYQHFDALPPFETHQMTAQTGSLFFLLQIIECQQDCENTSTVLRDSPFDLAKQPFPPSHNGTLRTRKSHLRKGEKNLQVTQAIHIVNALRINGLLFTLFHANEQGKTYCDKIPRTEKDEPY